MKFLCGNCKAKYQIADEKVSGRTLRMKCRRCGHDILIDGHTAAQSSPPQAATAAASSPRRGGGSVSVLPGPRGGSGAHAMPTRGGAAVAAAPALPRPTAARSKPPQGLSADFRRHVAAPPEVPQRSAPYDLWHVAIQDVPVGPMTRDELARKIDAGAVNPDSLCWREGMDDWRPLGELPELAQLLRRAREPSRPQRARPTGALPRPAQLPFEDEELDDDGAEPTRVSEFLPPLTQGSQAGPMPSQQGHIANIGSSPRLMPMGLGEQSAVTPAHAPESERRGLERSGLVAIGILLGILVVGGPMLYRTFWGAPAQQEAPVAAKAPAEPARPAPPPVDLGIPTPEEKPAQEATAPTPQRPAAKNPGARPKSEAPKEGGKALSDEQLALIKRMGGGGNDPDLSGMGSKNEDKPSGGASQATLTSQQLTKVVKDNTVQLQRCYETALRAAGGKQDAAIKVTVNVVVGMSGTAKSVSTQGDGLGNMTDCIRQSVKRWRFPASGGDSEFAFPLVFQPGA